MALIKKLFKSIRLRLEDFLREKRIAELKRMFLELNNAGKCEEAKKALKAMYREVNHRSNAQVARMEKERGLA